MDELCSPEDIAAFRANLAGPTGLWLYEGVFHPMGEVAAAIYPAIADWLLTSLNDGRAQGYDRHVCIEEGTMLANHEYGQAANFVCCLKYRIPFAVEGRRADQGSNVCCRRRTLAGFRNVGGSSAAPGVRFRA